MKQYAFLDRDDRGFVLMELKEFASMADAINHGESLIASGKVGKRLEIHIETSEVNENGWGNIWENINFQEEIL